MIGERIGNFQDLRFLDGRQQDAQRLDGNGLYVIRLVVEQSQDGSANPAFGGGIQSCSTTATRVSTGMPLEHFAQVTGGHVPFILVVVFRLFQ